jgi:hypothetical protein
MGPTTTNGEMSPDAQERAREGVEHLQAAARELIEAARAALDVAEEWVNDPESVASLAGTLATVGEVAKRVAGTGGWPRAPHAPSAQDTPPSDDEPRVQRITVT